MRNEFPSKEQKKKAEQLDYMLRNCGSMQRNKHREERQIVLAHKAASHKDEQPEWCDLTVERAREVDATSKADAGASEEASTAAG